MVMARRGPSITFAVTKTLSIHHCPLLVIPSEAEGSAVRFGFL
jgi:hypothetical protein